MLKPVMILVVLSLVPGSNALAQECVHGPRETLANRIRREHAIDFAHRLNQLEADAVRLEPLRQYKRPSTLKLPPAPPDFELTFHTNGRTYAFSLKDALDPCNYAVWSDHDGLVYSGTPEPSKPLVLPTAK